MPRSRKNTIKTVFLVNPAAENGAAGRRWPELAHEAASLGLQGDTRFSERPGHLTELAREAAANADLLVAVGGDGTVNEVVNGIAGLDVELALIPRGTGGDFVRTFGIPRKLDRAVEVALRGRTRAIDLGRGRYRSWAGEDEESYFANIASAGMSGAIAKRTNETSKALGGKVSYAWATFSVFSRMSASIASRLRPRSFFSTTSTSEIVCGIGSSVRSARPVRRTTSSTSGMSRKRSSTR